MSDETASPFPPFHKGWIMSYRIIITKSTIKECAQETEGENYAEGMSIETKSENGTEGHPILTLC